MQSDLNREAQLKRQLKQVTDQINQVASRRKDVFGDSVQLVAVSKTYPMTDIKILADAGQVDFAENKVQELLSKQAELASLYPGLNIRWHLIGHLQRNKVRQIVGKVDLIHSVDSLRLITELEKRASQIGIIQAILLQFNVSGEESKYGFAPAELSQALAELEHSPHLKLCGLMTMAPDGAASDELRAYFHQLYQLAEQAQAVFPEAKELSMGMSGDYQEAIDQGATMVRIGSAIFGQRHYA